MTGKKVKKEKGVNQDGVMEYEVIHLSKSETVIYELLEEILTAVKI